MVRLPDGCGMEPEFRAGDFVYVDPDEPAERARVYEGEEPAKAESMTSHTSTSSVDSSAHRD